MLEAHDWYATLRAARYRLVHLLAIVGGLAWLAAWAPSSIPGHIRSVLVGLWPVCLAMTAVIALWERHWHRRRQRCLGDQAIGSHCEFL